MQVIPFHRVIFLTAALASSAFAAPAAHEPLQAMNFQEAKRFLKSSVHRPGDRDTYCGCTILAEGRKWLVDWASCGFQPRKNAERASRIEWEHVVPASEFGQQRQCWQHGGRSNCTKNDPVFSAMEGDPHNLVPVVGEVNGDRGNLKYGMVGRQDGAGYGQCQARVDFKANTFMPAPEFRGNAARTYFYFRERYGLKLSKQSEQLFTAWSRQDPVDREECRRNALIARKTGVSNRFVDGYCQPAERALRVGVR